MPYPPCYFDVADEMDQAAYAVRRVLELREQWLQDRQMTTVDAIDLLRRLLEPAVGGECAVRVRYRRLDSEVRLQLGAAWRIRAGDGFVRQAQRLLGVDALRFRMGGKPRLVADRTADMAQSV